MVRNLISAVAVLIVMVIAQAAHAREAIRIVGSTTVFPFSAAAAEQFGRLGKFRTPIVEANGTGGGIKMFCQGVGARYPDIANASRAIKPSELALCAAHHISNPAEFKLGYDGIVFANARGAPDYKLTKRHIFLALARDIPQRATLIKNPYTRWNEIDPALPNVTIEVYGPPPAEGTRDAFIEMVMQEACAELPEFQAAYKDEKQRKQQCGALREDGRFIELLGGNVMVQKLVNNSGALGVFSYSFLDQNRALVKANPVAGVLPTVESIINGHYSVARSLYMYVKREHAANIAGLKEFVQFLLSDAAIGPDGFLILKGLIPLSAKENKLVHEQAQEF